MSALAQQQAGHGGVGNIDTLELLIGYLEESEVTDQQIYDYLASVDSQRLKSLLRRLEVAEDFAIPAGTRKKKREGRRSRLKGHIYEQIVFTLFRDIKGVNAYTNVRTATNEIDVLVELGAYAGYVTPLRHWGDKMICECKNHKGNVNGTWLSKLHSVLQLHSAKVGILVSRKGLARKSKLNHKLQLYAVAQPPAVILCLNWNDLNACANGTNFLNLLNKRYVEVTANLREQLLVTGP